MSEEKELSKKVVTEEGNVLKDVSEEIEIPCPTCKGKGEVNDPNAKGGFVSYKKWPTIICRTCGGEGWVITNSKPVNQ